ncbi:MAG TPA: FecR domain-containing protein [Acetobacteraceae bacterium]|nr:FecR domain-containing protein [Acetobacteraceae bacterium]
MVTTLRGVAFAQAADRRRALAIAAPVFVGDLVGTAVQSALGLRLGAATQVHIGPETRLRIDRFLVDAGGVLELAHGAMVLDHDPAAGRDATTVRSPFGLIAVRGTSFFAGPSNGVFGVFAIRGTVTVVGDHTAIEVTAGLGTDVAHPGGEPTAPHPWTRARIEQALASVR